MRRYDETVQVRQMEAQADGGEDLHRAPEAFVWRGRLYVVREVLDTWVQRQPWWRTALDDPDARDVQGVRDIRGAGDDRGVGDDRGDQRPGTGQREHPLRPCAETEGSETVEAGALQDVTAVASAAPSLLAVNDLEEQVWRVEAGAGRALGSGVYELVRSGPTHRTSWRLAGVED